MNICPKCGEGILKTGTIKHRVCLKCQDKTKKEHIEKRKKIMRKRRKTKGFGRYQRGEKWGISNIMFFHKGDT